MVVAELIKKLKVEKKGHFRCLQSILHVFELLSVRRKERSVSAMAEDRKKKVAAEDGEKKSTPQEFLMPYPVSRLAPAFEPSDINKEIEKAGDLLSLQTKGKLHLLANQIKGLQQEALNILEQASRDHALHKAECGFVKKPGHTYHLYRKDDNDTIFSLISPEEWGNTSYLFIDSYRLENNMSWTIIIRDSAELK